MARALCLVLALLLMAPGVARAQQTWTGSYPEGPVWIGGTLYWAEMGADRVMAWDGGEPRVAWTRDGCGPTALARYRKAQIVVLCHLEGALAVLDGDLRLLGMIRAATDGTALRDPNDASADRAGGVWFSDPGPFTRAAGRLGRVYYLAPDGTLTSYADGLFYSNGVHVDAAGDRLLVSEHLARRILAYPITATGLGPAETLVELDRLGLPPSGYPQAGPDGLEIGPDGTLWFAEYGAGRLLGWHPDRGLVSVATTDAQFITNIAFGPDGLVAVTAPMENARPPFPGIISVFKIDRLKQLTR